MACDRCARSEGDARRMACASIAGLLFVLWPVVAQATVYSWRGEGGVLMMSNDPQDVPEDKRASVQTFTSKPAPKAAPEEEEVPYPPREESARFNAYQRGFEHGLEAAEREAAFAERLALAALAAVPQVPPAPIVIEQPTPPIMPYTASPYDDYGPAFYGLYAPYPPS